jgi:hypothetical protein
MLLGKPHIILRSRHPEALTWFFAPGKTIALNGNEFLRAKLLQVSRGDTRFAGAKWCILLYYGRRRCCGRIWEDCAIDRAAA